MKANKRVIVVLKNDWVFGFVCCDQFVVLFLQDWVSCEIITIILVESRESRL